MKNVIKIKVSSKREYEKYVEMLRNRGFEQIGTRLFEDNKSYVKILNLIQPKRNLCESNQA